VLVADRLSESDLLAAVECRVVAVLPRLAAADERLLRDVLAAADRTDLLAPGLLRDLLGPTARGNEAASLRPREVDVLRLMAEGLTTAEIARRLNYSQRTIKNIVYACTRRLDLRNRPHAVAYAIRAGAI
jgi:DNA-binding NarL/FixJ family response regulator